MLTFNYIKLTNYKSFKTVDFDYRDRGLTLVEGENHDSTAFNSNGSAKSALLSGMTYALFGKTGQDGEKADDIVNRDEGKNTSVILEYEVNGHTYRIERYRKHSEHKNKVLLFLNDTEITEKSAKDTNEKIEETIGMDYNIYTNTIMYGQGDNKTFVQATDKEKKDILSDIARISVYAQAQELVKEQRKETEELLLSKEREQEFKERDIEHTKELARQEAEDYQETENEIQRLTNEINTLTEEYVSKDIPARIVARQEAYQQLQDNPVEHTRPDYTRYEELGEAITKVQDKKKELEFNKRYLRQESTKLMDRIDELSLSDNCPTCGKPMDNEHAKRENDNLHSQISQIHDQVDAVDGAITSKLIPAINQLGQARENEELRLEEEEEQQNVDFKEYQEKLETTRSELNLYMQMNTEYSTKLEGLADTVASLEKVPKPRDYTDKLKELNQELEDLKEGASQLFLTQEAQRKAIDVLSREGVQSVVLDSIVPFLNEHANRYLNYLSGGTIRVNFTTQVENQSGELRDKFDVEVENEVGSDRYSGLSSGEKRRVDLAVSLAIQALVFDSARVRTNVVFYDEIFENLDSVASERVVEILDTLTDKVESVFVITHNPDLKPLFSNTVKVEKRNGESKVSSD